MGKYTLEDFMEKYESRYIQLMIGHHLVNIDTDTEGGIFIVTRFRYVDFKYVNYNKDLLVLKLAY